ncbi:MAG: 4Fe-4S binding protein [Chloroflexi bacterium]|nr:4Fe-4S binding protein [Chloroflexota bacterium]MCL5107312.1 4Fe-4S binding protein [Chloroflexota bacterium]
MYVVDRRKCDGCGTCVDECSLEAIKMVDGRAEIDHLKCTDCGLCAYDCPAQAVYEIVTPSAT